MKDWKSSDTIFSVTYKSEVDENNTRGRILNIKKFKFSSVNLNRNPKALIINVQTFIIMGTNIELLKTTFCRDYCWKIRGFVTNFDGYFRPIENSTNLNNNYTPNSLWSQEGSVIKSKILYIVHFLKQTLMPENPS